ncbi:MAG: M48 family metallopeptidase [Syntrophobacterales bacterium]|nr:MAG: M48 family metallopeptidase [Syntrophobacterales bacterium]
MIRYRRCEWIIHLLPLLLLIHLLGCATAPLTGRSQLILIPESTEIALGLKSYSEILTKSKLSQDQQVLAMVKEVGNRIALAAHKPEYEWEFNVIQDDKMVNAFALPGGKVAIYTGILPYTKDKDGLAAVMGHEVAHALVRHGGERMTTILLAQLGQVAMNVALKDKDPKTITALNIGYGVATTVGVVLPFSRMQESEADRIGLIMMAKAGYDPSKAVEFWKRMAEKKGKKSPPEFLSTHPADERRIEQIKQWLPEAMKYYESASNLR